MVPRLSRVRWCEGLIDFGPAWMCDQDLARLRELADGPAFGSTVDERPYAIAVLEVRGPVAAAATPATSRPRRATRGAVTV